MEDVMDLFEKFPEIKVGVIGDVMLDTYMWGEVERISPEAPVPIVALQKKELRIGGAGNVALNLQSLGAKSYVISVTGDDEDAGLLDQLFAKEQIDYSYTIKNAARLTTNKTRVISRNQHMLRLDSEITSEIAASVEEALLKKVKQFIRKEQPNAIILEDYNKGVLTAKVIQEVINLCKSNNIVTAVDPKRKNFFTYNGVDIFKPNLKEVKEALNLLSIPIAKSSLNNIHSRLHEQLDHKVSFITLSEKGVFYQNESESEIIPSHFRNIADVSGAGDTVIAVATLVYAAKKNVHLMAEVANIAGGLVCEEVGTAAINRQKLMHECELLLS